MSFATSELKKTQKKELMRLTSEEFCRPFEVKDGKTIPRVPWFFKLKTACDVLGGHHAFRAVLRIMQLRSETYNFWNVKVERERERERESPVNGYVKVHLSTCLSTIQHCVNEHRKMNSNCVG